MSVENYGRACRTGSEQGAVGGYPLGLRGMASQHPLISIPSDT